MIWTLLSSRALELGKALSSSRAEPGTSGLEKTAFPGELEFYSRSNQNKTEMTFQSYAAGGTEF